MNKKSLVIKNNYNLTNLTQMTQMANVLKNYIAKNNLSVKIVGRDYVMVEGWQFAGGLLGTFPRIASVENMSSSQEIKWKAQAEIINIKTGLIVSTGFAICSNKEVKKRTFDEYAVLSMAQTRAIGKAYRNVIGWVVKLAGYEGSPAEEMKKVGEEIPQINIAVGEAEETGIYEEVSRIQKVFAELGQKTQEAQMTQVKRFAEKKGFKFDGWKMTRSQAKELLATALKIKLEKLQK